MRNKTIAVVVTYNRKELLEKCIQCLMKQKGESCDVLVVDNASTDGTPQMLEKQFQLPGILYRNTGENLGGAGGFQYGVREAVKLGYEYIWIMDDDTLPEADALAEFFRADEKLGGSWGFLSGVAYWTDGSICQANVQKRNIFKRIGENTYKAQAAPVTMASFVSLLVKSEVVKKVGLPIGEYFIWTDDYEYTGRISREYPCYVVPGSRAVHAMKRHTRVNFATDDSERIQRYRCIYRNDVHCYRRYGISGWAYLLIKDVYTVFNILKNSKGNRREKIKVVWQGFLEGLRFDPKIEYADGPSMTLGGGNT